MKSREPGPRLLDRIGLHLSTGESIDGIWVGTDHDKPELVLNRLREALRSIKTCDPARYQRVTRDLKRIWATSIAYEAHFDARIGCVLSKRYVLAEGTELEILAASIVHEATHARLWHCGIRYEEEIRARVEAICVRRGELAFSAKLPNGDRVRDWARHSLATYCVPESLTGAALDKRSDVGAIEELRLLGAPEWVIRAIFFVRPLVRGPIYLTRWIKRRR